MDTRATIEAVLDKLYDARRRNDASAAAECFREDGRFMPNGAPAATTNRSEQLTSLKGLFDAFACTKLDASSSDSWVPASSHAVPRPNTSTRSSPRAW